MLAQTEFFTGLVKDSTRANDDYVNATNWSKAFGREWRDYRKTVRCKKLVKVLMADFNVTNRHIVETPRSKVHETWVHPVIAIDFAEWLAPEFSLFVKRIFIRYLKDDRSRDAEARARDHNHERVERAKNRLHCSDSNKTTAKLAFAWNVPVAKLHNDRYYGLYDMSASELRELAGIKQKQTPLDAMSSRDLNLNSLVNIICAEANNPDGFIDCGNNLKQVYQLQTGKKLEPLWEDKKMRADQAKHIAYGQTYQTELPLSHSESPSPRTELPSPRPARPILKSC